MITHISRKNPRAVFDSPDRFLDFLTTSNDRDFEGQNFDRKEVGKVLPNGQTGEFSLKDFRNNQVAVTISAFANQNPDGGLLVLGIASNGKIHGVNHLSEDQINSIAKMDYLVGHNSQFKIHKISVEDKEIDIGLIYVNYATNTICETVSKPRRAWKRSGLQNLELPDEDIQRIRRDKGIVVYENSHVSRFDIGSLDQAVYKEFGQSFLDNSSYHWSETDLLKHVGAITSENGNLWLTNAGSLFFSVNPEKDISQAFIRLLRFDISYEDRVHRPTPTYDKKFSGALTKQIRDFRTFIRESAFFEVYQKRKPEGGFVEEPEFPSISIDEAVVNAIAHRDYAITSPILCEKYTDAFVVISPGGIIQNSSVPGHFSLEDHRLEHYSRNPKIMEWLRSMKDAHGSAFVLALQEGTRKMRDEMAKLDLPSPEYITSGFETRVVLRNNAKQRREASSTNSFEETSEYTNLYPLVGVPPVTDFEKGKFQRREILDALKNKLTANGWFIDKSKYGLLVAHRKGISIPTVPEVSKIVKLYPSYIFQIKEYFGKSYLLIDYTVSVQSVMTLSKVLEHIPKPKLIDLRCIALTQNWSPGRISRIESDHSSVFLFDLEIEENITNNKIVPRLPQALIKNILGQQTVTYDLDKEIRKAIFGLDKNASRIRSEYTRVLAEDLSEIIFPLKVGSLPINLLTNPMSISSKGDGIRMFRADSLKEPQVEFSKHHSNSDVREGITAYGSYDNSPKNIEIVPLCSITYSRMMEELIDRLRVGKFKFKGSERTFGVKLTYNTVVTAEPNELEKEINRLLNQHPEWKGNQKLDRLFLLHCPENGLSTDDENSPYYKTKRILLEAGIPCQMIDTPTLQNPDYKDLNLALNIVAKCGQTPWVLPESIPDCDFFIGLSYTQSNKGNGSRLMAFANVFNEYGRWEFYSGGIESFSFEERTLHYESLVIGTLTKLRLSERPTICFHYSAKFSREDKQAILKAARSIRPNGTYVFVWINMHHHVRLYDSASETNGSFSRGRYIMGSDNQIYLSTTGHNPYRKGLGTPQPLELNISVESLTQASKFPDLRVLASHVLSLTKLNWASTDSLCAEPITTKYAGDIAYLTAAFMRQGGEFKLHSVLERTPWFI